MNRENAEQVAVIPSLSTYLVSGCVRGRLGAEAHDVLTRREIGVADDLVIDMDNPGIGGAENRQVRLNKFAVQIDVFFAPSLDRRVKST